VNSLFHRDKQELREEEIIGRVSGHNPRVEEIQNALKEDGFDPGPIDGVMGAQTRAAIKGLQKAKGLKATGKIDSKTQLALNRKKEMEKPSLKIESEFDLEDIDSSDKSRQIQTALKKVGFYKGKIDGKTGPRTKEAIKAFQRASGLKADGAVGDKTWAELNKYTKE
jgi:peptidoglycan hydrolase-like protein with peptidoglycan-binding domain